MKENEITHKEQNTQNNLLQIVSFLKEENSGQNKQIELLTKQIKRLEDTLNTVNTRLNKHNEVINVLIYK